MNDREVFWTQSGVRLRRAFSRPGRFNWLFVPGGPGVGSESLRGLADVVDVAGTGWFVDLPGDGSNFAPVGAGKDPFVHWPHALLEAARSFDDVVMVGHSTGGMFILSVSEFREHLSGLVLAGTAPNAEWQASFNAFVQRNPLPAVDAAAERYSGQPGNETLRDLTMAAAPWNFTSAGLAAGLELFGTLPINAEAVTWAAENFDAEYSARWFPEEIPTLIMAGACDNIVDQSLWDDSLEFEGSNVMRRTIDNAGHFPWIENPQDVAQAFADFAERLSP